MLKVPTTTLTLLDQWIDHCVELAAQPSSLWCGSRKIIRSTRLSFTSPHDATLTLDDAGYTRHKMTALERLYLNEPSLAVASELWSRRRAQAKYGSVGFTTYNHLIKSEKTSIRGSVMGPCIQSVTLTLLTRDTVAIDAFYRTTELLKKFPADLVLIRDKFLPRFDLSQLAAPPSLTCHFANITLHPMYIVTILPHIPQPAFFFAYLRRADRRFWEWAVKWTAYYLLPEYRYKIEKFAQSMRVWQDVQRRLPPTDLAALQEYIRRHPPEFRR